MIKGYIKFYIMLTIKLILKLINPTNKIVNNEIPCHIYIYYILKLQTKILELITNFIYKSNKLNIN